MTLEAAVQEFVRAAQIHGSGLEAQDAKLTDQGYQALVKAFIVLKGIGPTGRNAILALCDHEDRGVRLAAALYSLKIDAFKAPSTLKSLSEGDRMLALTAKASLVQWRVGFLKLEGETP